MREALESNVRDSLIRKSPPTDAVRKGRAAAPWLMTPDCGTPDSQES